VGCEVSQGCLTCGGDHYWAYSHADSGQAVLTPSSKGVSSSTVRDGDEEGWKWGRGEPPAYVRPPPGSASTTTTAGPGSPPSRAGRIGGRRPSGRCGRRPRRACSPGRCGNP